MSTSFLYRAFGVRGSQYVRTSYAEGQVPFTIRRPRKALRCAACGSRSVRPRGAVERRLSMDPRLIRDSGVSVSAASVRR